MAAQTDTFDTLLVDGTRIHYRSRGAGLPVLAIHGLGADGGMWRALDLPGCEIVAVDLPGCGLSERKAGRCVPEALAGLFAAFLEKRGAQSYVVAGHSFGALVALELARAQPRRTRAALIVSPPTRLPALAKVIGAPLLGEALFGLGSLTPVSRQATRLYLSWVYGDRRKLTDEQVDAYWRLQQNPGYHRAVLDGLRGAVGWRHPNGELRSWAVPTAVVWGENDPLLPSSLGRRLASKLPGASFHAIAGCGHSPPEEAPEQVSAIGRVLLESASAPPSAHGGQA